MSQAIQLQDDEEHDGACENQKRFGLKNMTKEERYKWDMIDTPGEFMMIPVYDLSVAPEYQRKLQDHEILRFAREWSWLCCGALIVMKRNGGLFIVDGQQRWSAAKRRSDIKAIPCMVFKARNDIKVEADRFVKLNSCKVGLTGVDKYKASLVAEDPIAIKVESILSKHGVKVGVTASATTCACALRLMELCAKDEELFDKVFGLCVGLHAGSEFNGEVLHGLFVLEQHLVKCNCGETIFSAYIQGKLKSAGINAIKKSMTEAHAYWHKGGGNVRAQGILDVINTKRKSRIPNVM